jgi:hypothetical protein
MVICDIFILNFVELTLNVQIFFMFIFLDLPYHIIVNISNYTFSVLESILALCEIYFMYPWGSMGP